jgi:hypothetical protein
MRAWVVWLDMREQIWERMRCPWLKSCLISIEVAIITYLLLPKHVVKLPRCRCGLEWFCNLHNACFIHESCFYKGSGSFPPIKPMHSYWHHISRDFLAEVLHHYSYPYALGQQVIALLSYCLLIVWVCLLSDVASMYAIVQTAYCLTHVIVHCLTIVITYACY